MDADLDETTLMSVKHIPFTDVRFADVRPVIRRVDDRTTIVGNALPLPAQETQMTAHLWLGAQRHGDRCFLAERNADAAATDPWHRITYAQARQQVDALSGWLVREGYDGSRPILILSGNSIGHALLQLAATQIGIPVLPVSPNYSLADASHDRLRWIAERFPPSLVYAEDARYAPALRALGIPGERTLTRHPEPGIPGSHDLGALAAQAPGPELAPVVAAVNGTHIAKIILTSGSTGLPKGAAISHAMMLAAAESFFTLWPFLGDAPPVMVDWLPWNHTAGSNGTFNLILRSGGTLYIDDGKPTVQGIARTLENLTLVQPTLMFNVPRGYEFLVPELEKRPDLANRLLADLDLLLYAGAGLSQDTWDRLEHLSVQARGRRIPIVSSLGSTETASPATLSWWGADRTGSLGLPIPGVEAKLITQGDKTEIRFRGATVMSAYWDDPERSRHAFDEDGFFIIGDAVCWMDADRPELGFEFDGRLAENFKLSSGIWVSVGTLRLEIIAACSPWIEDVVIAGESRDELGLLVFLNQQAIQDRCVSVHDPEALRQATSHAVGEIQQALAALNRTKKGASQRVGRLVLEHEPLSTSRGEITDKGYVAQNRVLALRAERVQALYHPTSDEVVLIP